MELTAIIARRAPARLLRFEDNCISPLLGKMQRRRKSGEPAADDRDRHVLVGVEWRCQDRRDCGVRIKARRQRKGIVGHDLTAPHVVTTVAARDANTPASAPAAAEL